MEQLLIVRENYGFTPLRRAAMPFLAACVVLLMLVVNGSDEGGFSSTFYYVLSGLFFFISLLAGSYRRKNIIDKAKRSVSTEWRILFFKYKETTPLEHVTGVELVIGYKRTQTQISSGEDVNRTLRLSTNAAGLEGAKENNWHIDLYSTHTKEAVDKQAVRVCEFLDMPLKTTDHRLGLDAKISDF